MHQSHNIYPHDLRPIVSGQLYNKWLLKFMSCIQVSKPTVKYTVDYANTKKILQYLCYMCSVLNLNLGDKVMFVFQNDQFILPKKKIKLNYTIPKVSKKNKIKYYEESFIFSLHFDKHSDIFTHIIVKATSWKRLGGIFKDIVSKDLNSLY
jgi:hypothetical protein